MHWEVFAKDLSCVVLFLTLKTNRHEFLIFGINYAEVDMIKRFSILNFDDLLWIYIIINYKLNYKSNLSFSVYKIAYLIKTNMKKKLLYTYLQCNWFMVVTRVLSGHNYRLSHGKADALISMSSWTLNTF